MNNRWLAPVATVVAAMAFAAPAQAQLTVTQDDRGDSVKKADLKKVTTDHEAKRVAITSRMYRGSRLPDEVWQFVDTGGDATPDFLVFSVVTSEVTGKATAGVYAVGHWPRRKNPYKALQSGDAVDCGLEKGRRGEGYKLHRLTLGRGCFATDGEMPERLRVNTFLTFEWGKITDLAPGWRSYGRWVSPD